MRVISGIARGRKLESPIGSKVRPTTDRIKESLFNMLSADLPDCSFLDLFSGTGAIGIEALSRSAKRAVFVDDDVESCDIIKRNLEHTKLVDKAELIKSDAVRAVRKLKGRRFDIIFLDPPYEKGLVELCLNEIFQVGILSADGYVVCEQSSTETIPELESYELIKKKKYKTTTMLFFVEVH